MWGAILQWLMGSGAGDAAKGATTQGATTAGNIAAGAQNSGWGSMAKDLSAGNYASGAGNAVQMGQQNSQKQGMPQTGIPQLPQATTASTGPAPMTGGAQSPYLQQLMARYQR
jgi:hypothetical protein